MDFHFSDRVSSLKGSAIREIFKFAGNPNVISLAGGNPAPETFPSEELAVIAKDLLENQPVLSLQYGITEGYAPLREQVKARLAEKEGIDVENNDVMIVSGGQQGIDLTTKIFVNEGDTVIVEEPSFIGALNAFRSYNANLAGVPMDNDGMDIEALERTIKANKNVKIIYTIPTFQNPSGITMTAERRHALYEVARKYDLIIIEDNPYGELSFTGEHHNTIKSFDTDGRVIYCGSFSKVLAPGLRVGFMCAAPEIIAKAAVAKQTSDVHTPMLTQLLASEFLKRYDIDTLVEKARALYSDKCKTMLDAIDKYFPKEVTHTVPTGGLFIWVNLPEKYDSFELSKKCAEKNVVYVPGNTFMVDMNKKCSSLRLNYSTMSNEKIVEGIKILGEIFSEL
ncbi:MAG: PLP-dependent aminotransferase family protein [Clostridia bacterium]|nr:PLP-dependent aminotransferase family protein [Clostridia bacterium]